MMKIKKINDVVIKPIVDNVHYSKPIKGGDLFREPYANIFLLAKKKSGKTTIIYKILKECVGRDTRVYIFSSTVMKDKTYQHISEMLEDKKITFELFTSIYTEDKFNIIKDILDESIDEENEDEEAPKFKKVINFGDVNEEESKKKVKYIAPEIIFVFDDMGNMLKDPTIDTLLKTNRHYKSKCIISSQYLTDLTPQSRLQLDYVLVFKGLPLEKLETIYKDTDLSVDFDLFVKMYALATEEKYSFLYIDVRNEEFRIKFSHVIDLS